MCQAQKWKANPTKYTSYLKDPLLFLWWSKEDNSRIRLLKIPCILLNSKTNIYAYIIGRYNILYTYRYVYLTYPCFEKSFELWQDTLQEKLFHVEAGILVLIERIIKTNSWENWNLCWTFSGRAFCTPMCTPNSLWNE